MVAQVVMWLSTIAAISIVAASPLRGDAGLIVAGSDTLSTLNVNGQVQGQSFDFILSRTCGRIYGSDPDCKGHIALSWLGNTPGFTLLNQGFRYYSLGKTNFDSVKAAPSDSEMENSQYVFSLQPDSLKAAVGNVYALKTVVDPRREYPLYAKLKVLGFKVIDAEKHEIEMRFLWAANKTGYRDLQTSGLDTFDLETPTVARMSPMVNRMRSTVMPRAKVVFSRDGKGTPAVLVRPGGGRAVWVDLRGQGGKGRE